MGSWWWSFLLVWKMMEIPVMVRGYFDVGKIDGPVCTGVVVLIGGP